MEAKLKIKKGDTVEVISGDDKGSKGEVLAVDRKKLRVVVKGVNVVKKTLRKSQEHPNGGMVENEMGINISNVMLIDKNGNKTRVGRKKVDGKLKRYGKKSSEILDK